MPALKWFTTKPLRIRLVSIYGVAIGISLLSISWLGWASFWGHVGIPTMSPYFADLRIIQGAVSSAADGLNPQLNNPYDPWTRPLNYPRIWVTMGQWVHLTSEAPFLIVGVGFVGVFLACALHLLWQFPSRSIIIALCSSATLLCIERGNTDLLMYGLIYLSCRTPYPILRGLTFLAAVIAKLYPLLAGLCLPLKPQRLLLIGLPVIGYLWVINDQLTPISHENTAIGWGSYGFKTDYALITKILPPIMTATPWLGWAILGMVVVAVAGLLVWMRRALFIPDSVLTTITDKKITLFLAGAGIYCGTFCMGSHWDYRLIFLLLCLPLCQSMPHPIFKKGGPGLCLVAMNMIFFSLILPKVLIAAISIVVKTALFILLLHLFIMLISYQRRRLS